MSRLTISDVVRATSGILILGDPLTSVLGTNMAGKEVPSVSIDSRTLKRGSIFVALLGDRLDGHKFLNEAIHRGASALVVSQMPPDLAIPDRETLAVIRVKDTKKALGDLASFWREKQGENLTVAGIAGSCGKTTVKEMAASIFSCVHATLCTPGNLNNEIGCPLSVLGLGREDRYAIFEIGASYRGEVRRLSEIVRPASALITNIRLEHSETFGGLQNIAEGESEILEVLPEGGWAILPQDDPFLGFLKSRIPDRNIRIKTFGFSGKSSVRAEDIVCREDSRFNLLHYADDGKILSEVECRLPYPGRFNVLNACAAAALAYAHDIGPEIVRQGLEKSSPVEMRFNVRKLSGGALLIDDVYNANPGSMRASLDSFVEAYPDRERCVVLGDMLELGEVSRDEHYALGQYVARLPLSRVFFYGTQSRFSAEGASDSFLNRETLSHTTSLDELCVALKEFLMPGKAILMKASRGVHLEELIRRIES